MAIDARVRAARILPPDTVITYDARGRVHAHSPHALGAYPATLTERLDDWADRAPDQTFLASRDVHGEWRRLTYRAAQDRVRRVAAGLTRRRLSADRPIAILSGNGIEHAIVALAAMHIGVPYAPIAPAYSLISRDYTTLRAVWSSLNPGLVFVDDVVRFERALGHLPLEGVEVVACGPLPDLKVPPMHVSFTAFEDLSSSPATGAVDDAHAAVGPDTIAKVLFTSGSTGAPKGVICTQRMLSANQEQLRTVMAFLADAPPVLCDWLPWNHVFGGNHNFGIALYNGGTLYIDGGAPTPSAFATTLANLREIATTAYFNVPRGYEMLLPALREDTAFRQLFFRRLNMLFYAAAGIRQQVADEIEALALETCGERIPWVTGLGSTETAPFAVCTGAMPVPVAGRIGVPVPGMELKAEPVGDLFEARVRGPNVFPGYWRDPALTRAAFDDEGFFRTGDAMAFVDPGEPARGFTFEGRLLEDFKLSTGTWVRVGPLRVALLAALGDLAQDVAIAGHDRDDIRILVFPGHATCRRLAGVTDEAPIRQALAAPSVVGRFASTLGVFNESHTGSSTRIARALLLEQPPSLDAAEVTDKGSLNQKAVLRHRARFVQQLYGDAPADAVMIDATERGSRS